jgi:hypothetical protein
MIDMQAAQQVQGSKFDTVKKYTPHVLIVIGLLSPLITTIVLSNNTGTADSNQELRKYVGYSAIPVIISMIILAIGAFLYFSRNPEYIVYFAITAAIFAMGISNLALCVSIIDKQIS